jgi:hypothetical protein
MEVKLDFCAVKSAEELAVSVLFAGKCDIARFLLFYG